MNTHKKKLADFIQQEIASCHDSAPELQRRMKAKGIHIFSQKFLRWANYEDSSFPNFYDLERLAQWKELSLPVFLVTYLDFAIPDILRLLNLEDLSTTQLAALATQANSIVSQRLISGHEVKPTQVVPELVAEEMVIDLSNKLNKSIKARGLTYEKVAREINLPIPLINFLCLNPNGCKLSQEAFSQISDYLEHNLDNRPLKFATIS